MPAPRLHPRQVQQQAGATRPLGPPELGLEEPDQRLVVPERGVGLAGRLECVLVTRMPGGQPVLEGAIEPAQAVLPQAPQRLVPGGLLLGRRGQKLGLQGVGQTQAILIETI